MNCPSCGTAAQPGQKFCSECGTALAAVCPACGHAGPPGGKFCPECGTAIGAKAPPGPTTAPATERTEAPERRFVSVLFADLVGFTPFSESRDPEDVRAMLTRYFDRSRAIVERYSGEVDKFIGDALMAVWGAAEAHEDDPERATRAALDLVDMVAELGAEIGVPDLRLRAGVLTGETSVGPGGNEKGLVVGDLVNTASRLQSIAEPGTTFVGQATFDLVNHVIAFTPMGDHDLKGKSEPVPVYRAERVVAGHGGRRRADRVEPPFVSREDELRLLKDQLHAVGREKRGRLVSIVGEAGIGKSRLTWELLKYLDGLPETTYWHEGRSPSYGEGLTFWSLGEMVKSRAGIAETDEPNKSRMKLRTALAEYVRDEEERRWLEPWLAGVLGLDPMPEGDQTELFATLRTFFHRVADLDQTVMVFEDLHWADQGTLDFVEHLVSRSQRHPILVITLSRPDLLDRHPGWGSGRGATSVRLSPLSDDAMGELVTGMVPGVPEGAVAAITERAAGIPLYAVEFVRMLLASGDVEREESGYRIVGDLEDLSVPDSLQGVVGSRIDRLDPEDRALVQDAAVLGQSFTLDGLLALRGGTADDLAARLMDLVRTEMLEVDDDPRSPERGQYHFVQSVIREVAYGRLSRSDRFRAHQKVADVFEDADDPELAGAVAQHLMAAREAAPDGERDGFARRALEALHRAAERARSLHSHAQALSLSEQAIEIAQTGEEQIPFRMIAAGSLDSQADHERAIEMARAAFDAADAAGNHDARLETATLLGSIMAGNWLADEAAEVLEPVYTELEELDSPAAIRLAAEMGRTLMLSARHERAVAVCDRALAAAEPAELTRTVVDAVITKGTALGNGHRPLEAILLLQGAADLADRHDLPSLALRALNNLSVVQQESDPRTTMETWSGILERAQRLGDRRWILQATNVVTSNLMVGGRFAEGLELLREIRREPLTEFWEQVFTWREAETAYHTDPSPEAFSRAWEVVAYWDDSTDPQLRPIMDMVKSDIALYSGDWGDAYRRAADVMARSDLQPMWSLWNMAIAAAGLRDADRLEEAGRLLDDQGLSGAFARSLRAYLAGASAALRGDTNEAASLLERSLEDLHRVGTPKEIVATQATYGALLGLDHAGAAAAAGEARDWIAQTGSHVYREMFGDGLPAAEERATETA